MAYGTYETHPYLGQPVELYDFLIEGVHHRYASHDEDVVIAGVTWQAQTISRNSFSKGNELARNGIDVNTVLDLPIMSYFGGGGMPEGQVDLTVYRVHLTDPDLELVFIWTGQITSIKRSDRNLVLKGEVPEVHLKSVGLRRRIQRSCPHPLYGTGCFVNKETYKQLATISAVLMDGKAVTISITDCSQFAGGLLAISIDQHWKYRFVAGGLGAEVYFSTPANWLAAGQVVSMYPGCNKSTDHCQNRFGNLLNYGGFPFLTASNLYNVRIY